MFFSTEIAYATIRVDKMSDDNLIEFCKYVENIYPAALNESVNIANVLVLSNGKHFSLLNRIVLI